MKVIKKGRKQTGWTKQYKCTGTGNGNGGCGATLEVSQGDLYRTESSSMGEVDYYITFECPDCKCLTDVFDTPFSARDLPHMRVNNYRREPDQFDLR